MAGFEFLLAGRTLADRYRLDAVIGRGGMGAVFRAVDQRLERPVAVKVVASHEDDGRMRARFRREAQAAARIRHANVVTVFDFGTDPELGLDFLVMELLEGEDLARRVARHGALPPALGVTILRETAQGLAAGHRLGLVHRDVKPGNVFLAGPPDAPRAVLLDYGIAKVHAEEDDTHTALTRLGGAAPHSPGFAAPEQLRGDVQLTPACDVFSLAATAYYALSGERAFSPQQLQALAAGESVPLAPLGSRVPDLPERVEAAIGRALDPEPAGRPADADALLALLSGAEPLPPVTPPAPTSPPHAVPVAPARTPVRLRPWLWALGAAAVGGAVLAAVIALQQPGAPAPVATPTAIDSAALADSMTLAAARADSAVRAEARRDSARVAARDSAARVAPPADSVPADSALLPPAVPAPPPADVYGLAELDRRPALANRREMRRTAERLYPPALRDAGVEGRAEVALIIGADGVPEPESIRVLSADNELFADAAVRIARSLRFRPGQIGGRRVRVTTTMPIDFRLSR